MSFLFAPFVRARFVRLAVTALTVSFIPMVAGAQAVSGLFNTGVNGTGVRLATGSGATDTHYKVVENVVNNVMQQAIVANYPAYAFDANSSYIWQQADGNPGGVTRTFRTTFTLNAGYNPLTAVLNGAWSTDNAGTNIILNNVASGKTSAGFNSFTSFSITNGFVVGLNTLDFVVRDDGSPGALAVTNLAVIAAPVTPPTNTVPEPSTVALVAAGIAVIAAVRRKHNA
ncbi:MAG: PEP-CTERM sorting domain-containing protein [Gemmatimonas sp.]